MNRFSENYCRICLQFFCCVNCRLKHEENFHDVCMECDICIYGKMVIKNPSENLLSHLKNEHFPLHCLNCKTVFQSNEELVFYCKCTGLKQANQEILGSVSTIEKNYDSPPTPAIMHKSILTSSNKNFSNSNCIIYLTTSTPMQNPTEWELQIIPEVITPVDYPENPSEILRSIKSYKSIISDQSKSSEVASKRKVTFCETPIINNHDIQKSRRPIVGLDNSSTSLKPSCLPSALKKWNTSQELGHSQKSQDGTINGTTLWESALTDSLSKPNLLSIDITMSPLGQSCEVNTASLSINSTASNKVENISKDLNNTCSDLDSSLSGLEEKLNYNDENTEKLTSTHNFNTKKENSNNELGEIPNKTKLNYNDANTEKLTNTQNFNTKKENRNNELREIPNKTSYDENSSNQGVWSSVANAWKSVLKGLSGTTQDLQNKPLQERSLKRPSLDDISINCPPIKRTKIVDIRCRRPIHEIPSFRTITYGKKTVMCYDKATQTD